MQPGDELILLPGTYSQENGTGILRSFDNKGKNLVNSAAIISGLNRDNLTLVKASEPGTAIIVDHKIKPIQFGTKTRKDRYIKLEGVKVVGGLALYNTEYITVKSTGINGNLSIGANDHHQGNSYNLIEDVWVWSNNLRTVGINYRSHFNVWRRVVLRSDGCDKKGCEGAPKADPSIGITVYDSHDVSMQNIIVIDRKLRADVPYGDFATAQHTKKSDIAYGKIDGSSYFLGHNEWLGAMSINSQDSALHFEADNVLKTDKLIWHIKDFVVVGNSIGGINIGNTPYNYRDANKPKSLVENTSVFLASTRKNASAIRVSPQQTSVTVKNSITVGATRTGYNIRGSRVENSVGFNPGSTEGEFDTNGCEGVCKKLKNSPMHKGEILYPTKVEKMSSFLASYNELKIGAEVLNRYGLDGTTFSDLGYNKLTQTPIWPWPNEKRIKKEMCIDANIERGFCSKGKQMNELSQITLTSYIWEFFGNPMPEEVYQ